MSAVHTFGSYFSQHEYFAFEKLTPLKHEYFEGRLYAMADVSPCHTTIMGSVVALLGNQLRGRPCEARASQQRLRVKLPTSRPTPMCSSLVRRSITARTTVYALLDATVIVEVLSPSTANYDKGTKFDFYCQLPSLRHYVLIAQDYMEVEHRWLDAQSGEWQRETCTGTQDIVHLEAIDCTLSVAELYERVEF